MSLHQPIKMPVSVFSSEDDDAPQLSQNGAAGEIKTILKACLITGYGSTAAQGDWEMLFEDGNKAVFKSTDPRATGYCLRIDHNRPKYGDVACYESMNSIDSGEKMWFNKAIGFVSHETPRRVQWRLLATATTIMLITHVEAYQDNFPCLFFGDFMTVKDDDVANCAALGSYVYSHGSDSDWSGFASKNYICSAVARQHNSESPLVNWSGQSLGGKKRSASPISSNSLFHPVYVMEVGFERGVMPFQIAIGGDDIAEFTNLTIASRPYLLVRTGVNREPVIIPLDFWLL